MTVSANTVWEVRTAGNDNNGGGFVAGASGTDWSQQDAFQFSGAALTVHASDNTKVLPDDHVPAAADVGNILNISTNTGGWTAGFYQITAQGGGYWTLDRSPAATGTTGAAWRLGGALASPGKGGAGLMAGGSTLHIKAGTYTVTSASTNVAAGCLSIPGGTRVEGYSSSRGDLGTAPLMQASGISSALLVGHTDTTNGVTIRNLDVDGAGLTLVRGFQANRAAFIYKCKASNCTDYGFYIGASFGGIVVRCGATGCSTNPAFYGVSSATFFGCEAYANSITGFYLDQMSVAHNCLSYGNTGGSSRGFHLASLAPAALNCSAYNNGGSGFYFSTGNGTAEVVNCLSEGNAAYGYDTTISQANLFNCAGYNNTSGNTNGTFVTNTGFITGSASFFTSAGSNDFSLNNTVGGGASVRAAAYPGVFPRGTTTGYLDVGAAQHVDTPATYVISTSNPVIIEGTPQMVPF